MSGIGVSDAHLAQLEAELPGLTAALKQADKREISSEECTRQILKSMKQTPIFLDGLDGLGEDLGKLVKDFMDGKAAGEVSKGFKLPMCSMDQRFKKMVVSEVSFADEKVVVLERDGTPVKILLELPFTNWSATVSNSPKYTFVPTTVVGVQNIVQLAAKMGKRVRVAGFRQTWSNMYSEDSAILISLLDLAVATGTSAEVHADAIAGPTTEFNQIELAEQDVPGSNGKKRLARIGAGVTNEAFRIWSIKHGWTVGSNVIAVENCFGGANAPICHGAGHLNKTPNDAVRAVEYVDANGKHQRVEDSEKVKAAAGAFGLLGVVTYLTFELDKMTYANLHPAKQHIQLAIPPPGDIEVPEALKGNFTEQQLKDAELAFAKNASSYYSEWFWFPYKSEVWINCWDNTTDETGVIDTPDETSTFIQWLQNSSDAWLNSQPAFKKLPGRDQGSINGSNMINRSPPSVDGTGIAKTYLINGIHYRRGTQNFPILDTEFEIPILPLASDPTKPDWTWARRAYWDAVKLAYDDEHKTGACRIGIEMRIISDSNVLMAPQTGNTFGTASIEIISTQPAGEDKTWHPFVQRIVDVWTSYKVGEVKLNVRPHWAKEWEAYTIDNQPIKKHLKEFNYKDEIPKFKGTLADIGKDHGWVLEDIKARFSNPLLDSIYFE